MKTQEKVFSLDRVNIVDTFSWLLTKKARNKYWHIDVCKIFLCHIFLWLNVCNRSQRTSENLKQIKAHTTKRIGNFETFKTTTLVSRNENLWKIHPFFLLLHVCFFVFFFFFALLWWLHMNEGFVVSFRFVWILWCGTYCIFLLAISSVKNNNDCHDNATKKKKHSNNNKQQNSIKAKLV